MIKKSVVSPWLKVGSSNISFVTMKNRIQYIYIYKKGIDNINSACRTRRNNVYKYTI